MLALTSRVEGNDKSFDSAQIELIRTGDILTYLATPDVQQGLLKGALVDAQQFLRRQQLAMTTLLEASYSDLEYEAKRAKFKLEIDVINRDYERMRSYSVAAENTMLLIGALSGNGSYRSDVQQAFAVINATNELVRSGRALRNAVDAGMLASAATVTAYANGVGAVLTLVSVFAGSAQHSELEELAAYLDERLKGMDNKLNTLLDASVATHHKLDALLEGQRAIAEHVTRIARSVRANRVELRLIRESVENLEIQLQEIARKIDWAEQSEAEARVAIFHAELKIAQEQALREADIVVGNWLNPDSRVITLLNSGEAPQSLIDDVRRDRQVILETIASLGGPEFVVAEDVLRTDVLLHERRPAYTMGILADHARSVDFISAYFRDQFRRQIRWHFMEDETEQDVYRLYDAAFPRIDASDFADLLNPDALAYVLERYLTFVLALNEDARARIGFSDLEPIVARIEQLSESKRAAQAASLVMLSAVRRFLPVIANELKENLRRGRLFTTSGRDLDEFVSPSTDEELTFFDSFVKKGILEVSDNDIAAIVGLIESDQQLLRFAEDEGLIRYELVTENEPADINGSEPGLAVHYATVAYGDYHVIPNTSDTVHYPCRGAELRLAPGAESIHDEYGRYGPWPSQGFAFPLDMGQHAENPFLRSAVAVHNSIIGCVDAASSRDRYVPHGLLMAALGADDAGRISGADYVELMLSHDQGAERFIRDRVLVEDGSKLWYRGTVRCALNAEWSAKLAGFAGVDLEASIGTVANYIVYTLDSPLVYESQMVVRQANSELYAEDGTEIVAEEFVRGCPVPDYLPGPGGIVAQFSTHPGRPVELGMPRLATIVDADWLRLTDEELVLHEGFRKGVVGALQRRRAELAVRQWARVGELFREPPAPLYFALDRMHLTDDDRKELLDIYRSQGTLEAFFAHSVFEEFRSENPDLAETIDAYRKFIALEGDYVQLMNVFSEWGLGECLSKVPEYDRTFGLVWERTSDTKMTLMEALKVLEAPGSFDRYGLATATVMSVQSVLEDRSLEWDQFPPRPWLDEASANVLELVEREYKHEVIDHQAAIDVAARRGCRPGHGSIVALEELVVLMEGTGLIVDDEAADERDGAIELGLEVGVVGAIDDPSDVDYFRVDVDKRKDVTIWTTGDLDTVGELELVTDYGVVVTVAGNDDGGDGRNFRVARTLEPGTYYVKVTSLNDDPGGYTIHRSDVKEHSDEWESATVLRTEVAGAIGSPHDVDYFRVDVDKRKDVTIWTTGDTMTVGELERVTEYGSVSLAGSYDGGDGGNFRVGRALEPGTYYVRVRGRAGRYTIHRSDSEDHAGEREGAAGLATEVAGAIGHDDDVDYFQFDVEERKDITIWTTGYLDTVGELERVADDGSVETIASDDDGGDWGNFRIFRTLDAGTYYVKVAGRRIGGYTIHRSDFEDHADERESATRLTTEVAGTIGEPGNVDYFQFDVEERKL